MMRWLAILAFVLGACAGPDAVRSASPALASLPVPSLPVPPSVPSLPVPATTRVGPTHVAAIDQSSAMVAASGATGPFLLATADKGGSWERRELPAGIQFVNALTFASRGAGWMIGSVPVGTGGGCTGIPQPPCETAVFRSTDAGRSWTRVASEPFVRHAVASGLSHLVALDATHAWATTSHGCQDLDCPTDVAGTTDGRTWMTLATLPSRVVSLDFVDADRGWATTVALGSASFDRVATAQLYATRDGGRTWSPQFHATGITPQLSVEFVDRLHGWMLGNDVGRACSMGGCGDYSLYASNDGGETWDRVQTPTADRRAPWWLVPANSSGSGFLKAPTFVTPREGWIGVSTGAGPAIGGVLHTRDGGMSWTRFDADGRWSVVGVSAIPSAAWALVGVYGDARSPAIYRSTDGVSWDRVLESSP